MISTHLFCAKMLPSAGVYMARLTEQCDLTSDYDVSLLQASWAMRPIVDPAEAIEAMRHVANQLMQTITALRAQYRLGDTGHLHVTLDEDYRRRASWDMTYEPGRKKRRRSIARRIAMLQKLPLIYAIFRGVGVSLADLRIPARSPFKELADAARFDRVSIENW